MKTSVVTALALAALSFACSSSTTTPSTSSGGTSGTSGAPPASDTPPSDTPPADTPPAAAALKAPAITDIMKMMGGLHVTWTNNDTTCDAVEGERQAQMADGSVMEKYKVVFSVPGEADNKHDATATDNMKYTYRLRCKKGSTFSAYSNEMSGNPMQ